ncbi:AAA family ATPase [Mycobacterium sp. URHB0044]|uniref:AAA family ATPase n=1 Tax=Mycobacterium sp. URHB0044 TaxID=1380386 RepID=UPI00056AE626|nr:AAA family ATPase [Mycobacterium sp. URHB0044]
MKRLDLVVGPNGAGKSTFVALTLAPLLPRSVFVNADEIAKQRWPDDPLSHAYDAARVAAETRAKLIELGRSFIAETVFSHPSKLELLRTARAADFTVALHVVMIPEDLAVERVKRRVLAGGHDVPENKIRDRHRRLWPLVVTAITGSDTATIYDNSRRQGPRIVAQFSGGIAVGSPSWPDWTPSSLRLPRHDWPQEAGGPTSS